MPLFPLFTDLRDRVVLVVGGGEVATRKIQALLHAGARIHLHARELAPALAQLVRQGRIHVHQEGPFDPAWIDPAWLVVAATSERALNQRVAEAAGQRHRWVNVVDDAELSTYQIPAIIDRDPVLVAISSSGSAPMLARRLRERLEAELDHSIGATARFFAHHRPRIRQCLPDPSARRRWFEEVLDGELAARLRAGDHAGAEEQLEKSLVGAGRTPRRGCVALIGTGEGPDDLTLRALRWMNLADRILAAAGVPEGTLAMARRDAALARLPQSNLLAELILLAQDGAQVVCLRSGTGFTDEDGRALAAGLSGHGIGCELVPGPAAA